MSQSRWVRALVWLMIGVPLALSGTYVMVYLYRWEWNRALISGVFFLAAELALLGSIVLNRLGRLERQLREGVAPAPSAAPPEVDVGRESPFAWLDPVDGRLGVFVPLLLGAGVVFSTAAFLIERISGAVAHSRGGAGAPRPFGRPLPSGGLLAGARPATVTASAAVRSRHPALGPLALAAAVAALAVPSVGRLADATQTRPDPTPDLTSIEVEVRVRDPRAGAVDEAGALWVACRGKGRFERVEIVATGPGVARLSVTGVLGTNHRRELTGCLRDATLERVQARIVTLTTTPPPSEPG